jgi:hypothetical protein
VFQAYRPVELIEGDIYNWRIGLRMPASLGRGPHGTRALRRLICSTGLAGGAELRWAVPNRPLETVSDQAGAYGPDGRA